jgi:CubicO group peptidase (beta-lactamase class C family)
VDTQEPYTGIMTGILAGVESWPVPHATACVVSARQGEAEVVAFHGDLDHPYRLASITKMVSAYAILVAVEEAVVDLDAAIDLAAISSSESGSLTGADHSPVTLRHLLSHAAGFPFEGLQPVAPVGTSRIYSNTGIELAAQWLEIQSGITFSEYLTEAVLDPLAMTSSQFSGSAAHGLTSSTRDLSRFAAELLTPRLISPTTLNEAIRTQYPDLDGIVPGMGRYTPCPWGLGMEIAGDKSPHWMGRERSQSTFGHFGGAGTMMWVDPEARISLIALTDQSFDQWAATATRQWAHLSDLVLMAAGD